MFFTQSIARLVKFVIAALVCGIGIFLPYTVRQRYYSAVAFIVHLPYIVIGRIIRYFLGALHLQFYESQQPKP